MVIQTVSIPSFRSVITVGILFCIALVTAGCLAVSPPPAVLTYHRTGGIAGFSDHLVVYGNGTAEVMRNAGHFSCTLDREEMARLDRMFEQSGFSSLGSHYPAPVPGADYFSYEIMYQGRTVRTETTGIPGPLIPLISTLDELLYRCNGTL